MLLLLSHHQCYEEKLFLYVSKTHTHTHIIFWLWFNDQSKITQQSRVYLEMWMALTPPPKTVCSEQNSKTSLKGELLSRIPVEF